MITLPAAADITAVYDFKGIFEPAFLAIFKAAGFDSKQLIDSSVAADFQAPSPRIELMVTIGESTHKGFALLQNNIRVNCTWKGSLVVRAITRMDAASKLTHAQYRAQIVFFCSLLGYLVNNQPSGLTQHRVYDPITHSGSSNTFKSSDGFEFSDHTFAFDFSILPSAIQNLNALAIT